MINLQRPINRSFEVLPEELVARIFEKLPENERRQVSRSVSKWLFHVIQEWFGLGVVMKGSNRSRMPSSLYHGQITRLSLQDVWSANPHRLPPTSRLRKLEFSGVMRLGNLFNLLLDSPNLKELFITCPKIVGNETFDGIELLPPLKLTHFQLKITSISDDTVKRLEYCETEDRILKLLAKASLKFLQSFRIVFEGEPFPNNYLFWSENERIQSLEGYQRDEVPSEAYFLSVQKILQGSTGALKELCLARPYNESPFNTPNLLLEKLELNWRGNDLWLKNLLEEQASNKLIKVLSLTCSVQFWMEGIVQSFVSQLKESLTELSLSLNSNTPQLVDIDLSFFLECSKLRSFSFFTEWHRPVTGTGYNTFADLTAVVLPPRLERLALGGPFRPEALAIFCAHPNLKHLKLVYIWGFWENLALYFEHPQNAFYLSWEWLKYLVLNSPQLKEIILERCYFDIGSIEANFNSLPGKRINVKSSSKAGSMEGINSIAYNFDAQTRIRTSTTTQIEMEIHINGVLIEFTSAELTLEST